MLTKMRLVNFRTFKDFTVSFADGAYLVGPNNAGKSTILTALRTADVLLRYASSRRPDRSGSHGEASWIGYPIILRDFPSLRASLRHEFGPDETRLELTWKSTAKLTAVWPAEYADDREPFFFLERMPGILVTTVTQARASFPPLGVVPILTPVEHSEDLLDDTYVRKNIAGRLSSRHFRNQLRILKNDHVLGEFLEWAEEWLGEISIDSMSSHMGDKTLELDVFYSELGSRVPKELVWAGDGMQIWLQLLYHIYRVKSCDTIILDEPEVYLHPDLQRRLVQLLEATGRQVVLATHSSEVIAEADARTIVLVDKKRKRALRPQTEAELELLEQWVDEITHGMTDDVFGRLLNERMSTEIGARNHAVDVTVAFKKEFDVSWRDADYRRRVCPPKQIVASLNDRIQKNGMRTISSASLARNHRVSEIPLEMATFLKNIESRI